MREISIEKLKPGVFYMAKDKNYDEYRYQGTFEYLTKPSLYLIAHFKDCKLNNGERRPILMLNESGFVFYEKDAELIAYTNTVLRQITGDPDFSYRI